MANERFNPAYAQAFRLGAAKFSGGEKLSESWPGLRVLTQARYTPPVTGGLPGLREYTQTRPRLRGPRELLGYTQRLEP